MAERKHEDQYDNAEALDAEGIPTLEDPINVDEGLIPPRDHPQAVEEFGVTAAEQRHGEPLADRVLREEPDALREHQPTDRMVTDGDVDVDDVDDEKDVTAEDVDQAGTARSAEEEAVRVTGEPS